MGSCRLALADVLYAVICLKRAVNGYNNTTYFSLMRLVASKIWKRGARVRENAYIVFTGAYTK